MTAKRTAMSEQVRRAAVRSGIGCTALACLVEIDKSSISRFLNGRRGLSMAALNRLASQLNLELVPRRRRKRGEP